MKKVILSVYLVAVCTTTIFAQVTDTGDEVGIGTTSPATKLHVYGGASSWPQLRIHENGGTNGVDIGHDGTNAIFEANEGHILLQGGNVGIGTTTVDDQLSVSSTVAHGIFSLERVSSSNGNTFDFRISSNSNGSQTISPRSLSIVAEDHAADIALIADPSEENPQFVLKSSGNVGIGTSSPDAKLTVAGNIHSQEVKVTVDAGADFVFEDDYNLRSLEETEQFITENNHLPEIASADEMVENGLEVGEMNIKLLQKVEELTLYMIEMNKEIKSLKDENSELKNEMKELKQK